MQNFDFSTLYRMPPAKAAPEVERFLAENRTMKKQTMNKNNSYENNKIPGQNSTNRSGNKKLLFFSLMLSIAFALGLFTGLKINTLSRSSGSESRAAGSAQAVAYSETQPEVRTQAVRDDQTMADGVGRSYFVKLMPSLQPPKAQAIGQDLMDKGYELFFSKLSNGHYNLFAGPYYSQEEADQKLNEISKINTFQTYDIKAQVIVRDRP